MFASECRKDVEVGDERVAIRKLSARTLEKARQNRAAVQVKALRDMGGDVVKAMKSDSVEAIAQQLDALKKDPDAVRRQRYDAYDQETVLTAGVVSWTHSKALSPDSLADLDEETAALLHEAILDLSLPPLDPAEKEKADTKD